MRAFRAAWDYHLRNVMVIWYGAHLAGMFAALILYAQGQTWTAILIPALMVMCIAGVLLAVVALWGIRYPRPVKAEPRPAILPKPVQDKPTPPPDYNELPGREGQSYEMTMQRRKPAPDIAMSEPQLARYIMYLLDGDGVVSARGMAHIGTPADTAKVRRWLWKMRWADERNKTAVVHDKGRAALNELLPHLER